MLRTTAAVTPPDNWASERVDSYQEERHGQAVVEPAFDVQRLAHARRHRLVRDDTLPERRVGRADHRRQNEGAGQRYAGKDEEAGAQAGEYRQRQADEQKPAGPAQIPAQAREVDPRRVAEQQKDEGELAEPLRGVALDVDVHELESGRPDGEAGRREDHGRRDASRIERLGDRAVQDEDHGDGDESDDHASSSSKRPRGSITRSLPADCVGQQGRREPPKRA
jgi:hypothetical protein